MAGVATLQMTRPKQSQATGTWASIFPPNQATEQQSAQFVKRLLAVALSNLTYLRAIFPEQAFGDRSLDGLQLKILRDDAGCAPAWQITQWIKACFDALDKKYLRQLTVLLFRDANDPDTAIESYTFRFAYSQSGGVSMHHGESADDQPPPPPPPATVTSQETQKATVRLLRTIVVLTQTLRPLPDDVMMSMKLLYFDDVTPADYEPPGFRPAETHQIFFSTEPLNVRVGDVATPHHSVKLRLKTDASQFVQQDGEEDVETVSAETREESQPRQLPPVEQERPDPAKQQCQSSQERRKSSAQRQKDVAQRQKDVAQRQKDVAQQQKDVAQRQKDVAQQRDAAAQNRRKFVQELREEPSLADSVSGRSPARPASAVDTSGTPAADVEQQQEQQPHVHCVCGVHEDDGLMVLCELCNNWQHGICFLVLSEEEAPASHVCDSCALASGRPCTDSSLPALAKSTRMATCLYRRGLCACEEMSRVQPSRLAQRLGVDEAVASGLISRLDKDGLLKAKRGKGIVRMVDKARLFSHAFPRYLNRTVRPAAAPPADASHPPDGRKDVDDIAERAGRMEVDSPATQASGAGDGPSPRRSTRKRCATPKSQPDKHFEVADSQDFAPETVGRKRFKASCTDGIAA